MYNVYAYIHIHCSSINIYVFLYIIYICVPMYNIYMHIYIYINRIPGPSCLCIDTTFTEHIEKIKNKCVRENIPQINVRCSV